MMRHFMTILALLILSACRLDVTQTIDATAKGRRVITYTETFDDGAFAAATRLGGPFAFGVDAARQDGWKVHRSSGPDAHTFVFQRSFPTKDVELQLTRLARDSAVGTPPNAFLLGPTAFIGVPITVVTGSTHSVSIPALLRPSEAPAKGARGDATFQRANARINAAAVDSVVHVRIILRDATGVRTIEPRFADGTVFSPSSTSTLHVGQPWPIARILAFWRNVGPYGRFDYEHYAPPLCSDQLQYRKAWMFGIGVYADGARIPRHLMRTALTLAATWLAQHPVKCP